MKRQRRAVSTEFAIVLLAAAVLSVAGVLVTLGAGSQSATAQDPQPDVVFGQYRLLPPDSPDAPGFRTPPPAPSAIVPGLPGAKNYDNVAALQANVPDLSAPESVGVNLVLAEASGFAGPDGRFEAHLFYWDGEARSAEVFQWRIIPASRVIPVVVQDHPFEETRTIDFDGLPALLNVPIHAPDTNPRQLRWVEGGIETIVTTYGVPTTDEVMAIARSIRASRGH